MARHPHSEDRRASHALPGDARRHPDRGSPQPAETRQRYDTGSKSSLHKLAAQARSRKASQRSSISTDLISETHSDPGWNEDLSSEGSLTQTRSNSIDAAPSDITGYVSRSLSLVESPLSSVVFQHGDSTSVGHSDDVSPQPSPASDVSIKLYREEVNVNNAVSQEIEDLGLDLDNTITIANCNQNIGAVMIEYYTGNAAYMIPNLDQVKLIAGMYGLDSIAARAQLWKAMILDQVGHKDSVPELLKGILNTILQDSEITDADRYNFRKLFLRHCLDIWLCFELFRRGNSGDDEEPMDLQSPGTVQRIELWVEGVIRKLEDGIGDKIGSWPNLEESYNPIQAGGRTRNSAPDILLAEYQKKYNTLLAHCENLEVDVARYKADRKVLSDSNTRNHLPTSSRDSERAWIERVAALQRSSYDTSVGSWLGARSVSGEVREDMPEVSGELLGVGTNPTIATASTPQRKLPRKRLSVSAKRNHQKLRVRNKMSSVSDSSSRTSSSGYSKRRSSPPVVSKNWRNGHARMSQHSRVFPIAEISQPEGTVLGRRGSNLRNMALAESSNDESEDDISPKAISHKKPSYVQQRLPFMEDLKSIDEIVAILDQHAGGIFGPVEQQQDQHVNGRKRFPPGSSEDTQLRRRSSASNPEAVLQIDREEYDMTGALSPTELEQRYPKYVGHKEQERRQSIPGTKPSPASTDFPAYDDLAERLLNPQLRRYHPPTTSGKKSSPSSADYPPYDELAEKLRNSALKRDRPQSETKAPRPAAAPTNPGLALEQTRGGAGKKPDRRSDNECGLPKQILDMNFGFNHVQQQPQVSNLRRRRNAASAAIAPLTPSSKSPPSSAISVPLFGQSSMSTSPAFHDFVSGDDGSQDFTTEAETSPISPQLTKSTEYKPVSRGRWEIPDLPESGSSSSDLSNASSRKAQPNIRISTFLDELTVANIQSQRRGSTPVISSPLRSSFAPEEETEGLNLASTTSQSTSMNKVKPKQPSPIDTTSAHRERTGSIYDDINDKYPSPNRTDERKQEEVIRAAQRARRRRDSIADGYESDTEVSSKGGRSSDFRVGDQRF